MTPQPGHAVTLSGFGGSTRGLTHPLCLSSAPDAAVILVGAGSRGVIPRGGGRAYGDAALNSGGITAVSSGPARVTVDPTLPAFTAPAAATIRQVIAALVPRGLFVPVTPGTGLASIGGVIAADVHGKNHHRDGSIGAHVLSISLTTPGGETMELVPGDPRFHATIGGMGLTGVITAATIRAIRIESALMRVESMATHDLTETMQCLRDVDSRHRYSVAWLDLLARGQSLGRGVVMAGDHARVGDVPVHARARALAVPAARAVRVPLRPPRNLLSRAGVTIFNHAYYALHRRRSGTHLETLAGFFHPLDAVHDWNRLYGPRGFIQYQFVVPDDHEGSRAVVAAIEAVGASGYPGFLTVLKRFGAEGMAMLSFPRPGWTLTIDLPCGAGLRDLVRRLDALVLDAGGRIYLAKDATASPEHIEVMYPRLPEWRAVQHAMDPHGTMQSDMNRRLRLTVSAGGLR